MDGKPGWASETACSMAEITRSSAPRRLRGQAASLAIPLLLAVAAAPFVLLAPEPPAFARAALGILVTVAVGITLGTALGRPPVVRARIARRAALLCAVTVAATLCHAVLSRNGAVFPTADLLPRVLRLSGEDIDDAVLFERFAGLWLLLSVPVAVAARLVPGPRPDPRPPSRPPYLPWNAATVLLFASGCVALGAAIAFGHATSAFLRAATHTEGVIADPQSHPIIRFTTQEGAVVEFRQNGFVVRPRGAPVPVAYLSEDPAGTAQADTVWVNWSATGGALWIGLPFTLLPFFGIRAEFGRR